MSKPYSIEWKVSLINADFGCAVTGRIAEIAKEHLPHYVEMFPFRGNWKCDVHSDRGWVVIQLEERAGVGIPTGGNLTSATIINAANEIIKKSSFASFNTLSEELPIDSFRFGVFTYVGPYEKGSLCWQHIQEILCGWLNSIVMPEIEERNRIRVLRAVPAPPSHDLNSILSNIYVLECASKSVQGTCFNLTDIGLVTCEHVLTPTSVVFHASDVTKKFPIEIISKHPTIDIAKIRAPGLQLSQGLPLGSADELQQMQHIAIAGFPNFRYGDTGVLSPGLVIGFRTVSSIRRILVNIPIIAGNSGGPSIDGNGQVVGIAITGSDRMEDAGETENHGIVPIDTIRLI